MNKEKVKLEKEMETLLIPLYCRALETEKENPIIIDKKAVEIKNRIEYDFSSLKVPTGTYITTCMRAKKFDSYSIRFLEKNPLGTVISLGCGLDSRFNRVNNGSVIWYDLDFPEVIDFRKLFFHDTDHYHMITSPVMDFKWINSIRKNTGPVLIIAEGLFMYLKEDEVKSLVLKLLESFPGSTLVFDSFSELTVRKISNHPSVKKTKAQINWGLDDVHEIETWNKGITFIEEWFFTQSDDIKNMKLGYRIMFRLAGCFTVAKKAHRILAYGLG